MAEKEGVVVADAALLVVQVGVTDPAGLHLHHGLAGTRVRDENRPDLHRFVLTGGDDTAYLLGGHVGLLRVDNGASIMLAQGRSSVSEPVDNRVKLGRPGPNGP
jgi:hypothetical protein